MKTRTAILASGSGTTAEAFIRNEFDHDGLAQVVLVIVNRPDAGIIDRIERLNAELGLGIETLIINSRTHPTVEDEAVLAGRQTAAEQTAIVSALQDHGVKLVLLLGYMKLVGPAVIKAFKSRILNTHPGLLPATQGTYGIHASELVLAEGLGEAGQTLHIVSELYDDGPVIAENKVAVKPADTAETLFGRIQAAEKANIAADINAFINQA